MVLETKTLTGSFSPNDNGIVNSFSPNQGEVWVVGWIGVYCTSGVDSSGNDAKWVKFGIKHPDISGAKSTLHNLLSPSVYNYTNRRTSEKWGYTLHHKEELVVFDEYSTSATFKYHVHLRRIK